MHFINTNLVKITLTLCKVYLIALEQDWMKDKSNLGFVLADREKVDYLKLFAADKPKIQNKASNSSLSAIRYVVEVFKVVSKTYFDEVEHCVDEISPSEVRLLNLNTVKMFTAQWNRCDLPFDDAVTVIRNRALFIHSNNNMIFTEEVQNTIHCTNLAQRQSFPINGNGTKRRNSGRKRYENDEWE